MKSFLPTAIDSTMRMWILEIMDMYGNFAYKSTTLHVAQHICTQCNSTSLYVHTRSQFLKPGKLEYFPYSYYVQNSVYIHLEGVLISVLIFYSILYGTV